MIQRGEVACAVVGGADSVLNLPTMTGLLLLGAPSIADTFGEKLSRPFDRGRSGFVAAEGAGIVVLESEASARSRGVSPYAELVGYGSSMDAYRVTAPHPKGQGAVAANSRQVWPAGAGGGGTDSGGGVGATGALAGANSDGEESG